MSNRDAQHLAQLLEAIDDAPRERFGDHEYLKITPDLDAALRALWSLLLVYGNPAVPRG